MRRDPDYEAAFDRHRYVTNIRARTVETVYSQAEAEQRRDELEAAGVRVEISDAYHHVIYQTPEG